MIIKILRDSFNAVYCNMRLYVYFTVEIFSLIIYMISVPSRLHLHLVQQQRKYISMNVYDKNLYHHHHLVLL